MIPKKVMISSEDLKPTDRTVSSSDNQYKIPICEFKGKSYVIKSNIGFLDINLLFFMSDNEIEAYAKQASNGLEPEMTQKFNFLKKAKETMAYAYATWDSIDHDINTPMGRTVYASIRQFFSEEKGVIPNIQVAKEKLAYDLYALCGVRVPNTYLVENKTETGDMVLSLASEIIPGYKSLAETIGVNKGRANGEAINCIKSGRAIDNTKIKGLYENLAAYAWLYDRDGVGRDFSNIGIIKSENEYNAIKIDPGEAFLIRLFDGRDLAKIPDMYTKSDYFLSHFNVSVDRHDEYGAIALVSSGATIKQKLEGLKRIVDLSEEQIRGVVFNAEIPNQYLPIAMREEVVNNLLDRQKKLENVLNEYKNEYGEDLFKELDAIIYAKNYLLEEEANDAITKDDKKEAIQVKQMRRITSIFGKIKKFNSEFTSRMTQGKVILSSAGEFKKSVSSIVDTISLLPKLEEIKENIHPKNAYLLDKGMENLIQTFQENISIYNNTLPTAVTELVEKIKITDNKIQDLIQREELEKLRDGDFFSLMYDAKAERELAANLRKLDEVEECCQYLHIITQYDKSIFKDIEDQLEKSFLDYKNTLLRGIDKKLMIASDEVDNCGNEIKSSGITIDNFNTMIDKTKTLLQSMYFTTTSDDIMDVYVYGNTTPLLEENSLFVKLKNSISTCNDALSKAEALKNGSKGRIVEAILLPRFQDEIEHTLIYCNGGRFKALDLNLNTLLETSKQVKDIIHIAQHENENNHNQNENNTLEEEIKLCRLQLKEEQNAYDDVNNFIDEIKVVGVTDDAKAQEIQTALQKYKKNTEDLISDLGELDKKTVNKEDKKLIKTSIEASEQFVKSCNYVIQIANNNNNNNKKLTSLMMMNSCKNIMKKVGSSLPVVIKSFELIVPTVIPAKNDEKINVINEEYPFNIYR